MALTHTPDAAIGAPCPELGLLGVDDRVYKLADFAGARALVVMFICNHCPYVIAVEDRLVALAREFEGRPVRFVAICSNDGERYPADSFENMKKRSREKNFPFPYLHDGSQKAALEFGAVCTPDFFLYDAALTLAYRGRLDDSWKDPNAVRSEELKDALVSLLQGSRPAVVQKSSMGCSIKWKPGNLPT
jgi:peroxiredoxin